VKKLVIELDCAVRKKTRKRIALGRQCTLPSGEE
jgi:hypothetical protein